LDIIFSYKKKEKDLYAFKKKKDANFKFLNYEDQLFVIKLLKRDCLKYNKKKSFFFSGLRDQHEKELSWDIIKSKFKKKEHKKRGDNLKKKRHDFFFEKKDTKLVFYNRAKRAHLMTGRAKLQWNRDRARRKWEKKRRDRFLAYRKYIKFKFLRFLPRLRRFYMYRKKSGVLTNENYLKLNLANLPFFLKLNWDSKKIWNPSFYFGYVKRKFFFKTKHKIRIFFLKYLTRRTNSQLKKIVNNFSYKKQKLLFFFNRYYSRLDNFILTWGYIRNLTLSRSRFLIYNGFVYINFKPRYYPGYNIRSGDCVSMTYWGIKFHKHFYHISNYGSTKYYKNYKEFRHFHIGRRRKFIDNNRRKIILQKVRFSKFSHWSKKYFSYFFRFFESSRLLKVFVYFYFYSWFSYKFSKFIDFYYFSRRLTDIFLNTRLF